jgi:xylose isomerase
MKLNVDTGLYCLGVHRDRWIPITGYNEDMETDKKLEIIGNVDIIEGLITTYPPDPALPSDPDKYKKKLANFNLKPSYIEVVSWEDKFWKNGAFTSEDSKVRKAAVKLYKEAIDYAKALGLDTVQIWPAHDGYDYPFQANYGAAWDYFVETVREIGEYGKDMIITVEYKQKDPRQRQYDNNVGRQILLCEDIGLGNVGAVLDTGHAIMSQENLAESVVLLDKHKRLFMIHLNENYRDADPDLLYGTIYFWENIEMLYYLNKTDFNGWCSLDVVAPRDDAAKQMNFVGKLLTKYMEIADEITKHSKEVDENLKGYKFTDNMEIIYSLVFK